MYTQPHLVVYTNVASKNAGVQRVKTPVKTLLICISVCCRDLSFGRGTTAAVKGAALPSVNKIDAWDGKDGELPPEEDIDLSDINLDDQHSEL